MYKMLNTEIHNVIKYDNIFGKKLVFNLYL